MAGMWETLSPASKRFVARLGIVVGGLGVLVGITSIASGRLGFTTFAVLLLGTWCAWDSLSRLRRVT
jgi:hypothetical protein